MSRPLVDQIQSLLLLLVKWCGQFQDWSGASIRGVGTGYGVVVWEWNWSGSGGYGVEF